MVFESSGRRTWLMKDVLQAESPALAVTGDARHSRGAIARLVAVREAGIFGALVALCVALSLASPYFFTLRNVFNVLQGMRSEEHTSELQSLRHLVCRLLLEKK